MLGPGFVPSEYHSFATHWAFAVAVASNSFVAFADDSNCPSHFDSSPAIVDDVVGKLTLMSLEIGDLLLPNVAFVVPLDGMTKRNPCSYFA